jgi:hypothetical protein
LHRRADFLASGDAGRFIDRGVVETLEGAALAAIDATERWAELDFGVLPNVVAGGALYQPTTAQRRSRLILSHLAKKPDNSRTSCDWDLFRTIAAITNLQRVLACGYVIQ